MRKLSRASASLLAIAGLVLPATTHARGVSTISEAVAEFDEAVRVQPRPTNLEGAMLCAGFWLGLKDLHGVSQDVPFWRDMPDRLNAETAALGHQYWGAVVARTVEESGQELEAAGERVMGYRNMMIQDVVKAEETGGIEGVFEILGACVPE